MIIVENTAQVTYHPFSATQALSWRVCSHAASELSDPPGGKTSADLRRRAQQQELVNVVMIAMTLAIPPEKLPSWRLRESKWQQVRAGRSFLRLGDGRVSDDKACGSSRDRTDHAKYLSWRQMIQPVLLN